MIIEAMKHYEAALKEAFPRGATGDVFHHWNEARKAIEQAEKQEPVGKFAKFSDGIWKEVTEGSAGVLLYTSPPQRQPLSDEEMWKLWNAQGDDAMEQREAIAFARAIEAAHGIKENT